MSDIREIFNIAGMIADAIKNEKLVWVVRCKDCKWYSSETSWCNNLMSPKEQNFFCADGKVVK